MARDLIRFGKDVALVEPQSKIARLLGGSRREVTEVLGGMDPIDQLDGVPVYRSEAVNKMRDSVLSKDGLTFDFQAYVSYSDISHPQELKREYKDQMLTRFKLPDLPSYKAQQVSTTGSRRDPMDQIQCPIETSSDVECYVLQIKGVPKERLKRPITIQFSFDLEKDEYARKKASLIHQFVLGFIRENEPLDEIISEIYAFEILLKNMAKDEFEAKYLRPAHDLPISSGI